MSEVSPENADELTAARGLSRPRRRHFSKDLWLVLAFTAAAFGGVLWLFNRAWHQHELVVQIRAAGGRVAHDWEWSNGRVAPERSAPWWTDLLANFSAGPEFLTRVVFADLSGSKKASNAMSALGHLGDLRSIDLSATDVPGAELLQLASLGDLEELNLSGNALQDYDLVPLRNLGQLRILHLSGTALTDAGLTHLRELPGLERLDLSLTRITDSGLEVLGQFPRLESLTIDDTGITDAGLASLSRLETLRWLSVGGTRTTEAGRAALKKQMPRLKIVAAE